MATKRKRGAASKVEKAIVAILTDRGYDPQKDLPFFSQARDYGDLWRVKEMLLQDISERGVTIVQTNGAVKKNDSVDAAVRVNAQMLKILAFLKIDPDEIGGDQEEEFIGDGL